MKIVLEIEEEENEKTEKTNIKTKDKITSNVINT